MPSSCVELAAAELQQHGIVAQVGNEGVNFSLGCAEIGALLRRLRLPTRLVVRAARGRVRGASDVTGLVAHLPWPLLPLNLQRIALHLHAHGLPPQRMTWLQGELCRQLAAHAATVDTRASTGDSNELTVSARTDGDDVQLSLDVGGAPLNLRGYRLESAAAPLSETVAAQILALAGYDPARPLWDPMCGSGTLAIEAALWQQPLASRVFAIDNWRVPQRPWPEVGRERGAIVAGDMDAEVLAKAQRNAQRAAVVGQIAWQHAEILDQSPPDRQGLVVVNPPWGQRLGGRNDARRLIARLGAVLQRRVPGWHAAVVLPEKQLLAKLPLRDARLVTMQSGGTTLSLAIGTVAS